MFSYSISTLSTQAQKCPHTTFFRFTLTQSTYHAIHLDALCFRSFCKSRSTNSNSHLGSKQDVWCGWLTITIIFQTAWHLAAARSLLVKFSHDGHNKDNDRFFNHIKQKTKQYNDQSRSMCIRRARFCRKQNTHAEKN